MHCKLTYISIYTVLYSTDSHWSISLKVQEGNVIRHKTLRMLEFHPFPAFMKTYTNFKKIFLVRVFCLKYIFRIKFKIPILDLMRLPKNCVPFEGLYSSSICSAIKCPLEYTADDYFVTSNVGVYDAIQAAYIVLRIMGY